MVVPTVNVTLTVDDQTGAVVPGATVTAQLSALDIYQAQYIFPIVQTFLTDVTGKVTMPLFPSVLGQNNTYYTITATHPITRKTLLNATCVVPNTSPIDVSVIAVNTAPTPTPNAQPSNPILTALAALTPVVDQVPYFTGPASVSLASFTAVGRSIVAAATLVAASALFPGPFLTANGTAANPAYAFSGVSGRGMFNDTVGGFVGFSSAAAYGVGISSNIALGSAQGIYWYGGATPGTSGIDVVLLRDAANTLALRNGAGLNPQAFNIYNTYTDAANYERLIVRYSGNVAEIRSDALGTGIVRPLRLVGEAGSAIIDLKNAVDSVVLTPVGGGTVSFGSDNTFDLGRSAAGRPRTGYFGTSVVTPTVSSGATASLYFNTSGGVQMQVVHIASVTNNISIQGAAAGGNPAIYSNGSDIDVPLIVGTKGAGRISFQTGGVSLEQFRIAHIASAVNYVHVNGGAAGAGVNVQSKGSDANVNLDLVSQGTGRIGFYTNAGAAEQFEVVHTANAVNFLRITGNITTGSPFLSAQGTDANVGILYDSKGSGAHGFRTNGGADLQVQILATASANRSVTLTGSNGGNPTISVSAGALACPVNFVGAAAVFAYNGTATPAGGAIGTGFLFSSTPNYGVFFGSGAPTLTAAKGSLYLRSDGTTTNNRAYINTDGGTTWTALTTVA
jgi:hypothetical protein